MTLSSKNGGHSEAVHFSVSSDAATVLGRSELQTCTRYSIGFRGFVPSVNLTHKSYYMDDTKMRFSSFYRKGSSKLEGVLLRKHVSPRHYRPFQNKKQVARALVRASVPKILWTKNSKARYCTKNTVRYKRLCSPHGRAMCRLSRAQQQNRFSNECEWIGVQNCDTSL